VKGGVALVLGVAFVALGVTMVVHSAIPAGETARTTGTVVAAVNGSSGCVDTVRFSVGGHVYRVTGVRDTSEREDVCSSYQLGNTVTVAYAPSNPDEATLVPGLLNGKVGGLIAAVIGLGLVIVGVVFLLGARKPA
jgi:hypothetical protein